MLPGNYPFTLRCSGTRQTARGAWVSFILGIGAYLVIVSYTAFQNNLTFVEAIDPAFEISVFVSTAFSIVGMALGSYLGQPEQASLVKKFHVILNTPIGQEQRLIEAGIALPALDINEGSLQKENLDTIDRLYKLDADDKVFWIRQQHRITPGEVPALVFSGIYPHYPGLALR